MDKSDIAIATMTLVRSPAEEDLLSRTLQRLAELDMPLIVTDAGASATFVERIRSLPGVTLTRPPRRGLVEQVQDSIRCATETGRHFVLYTEPDKLAFVSRHLHRFLASASDAPDVGLVLAARSDASFATYPPTQRYVESVVNELCGARTGVRGDYSYGPFIMTRRLARHVSCAPATLGWGWRPFVFVASSRQGFGIQHVVGDYECPPDQMREDEAERLHRLRQLRDNVAGLIE